MIKPAFTEARRICGNWYECGLATKVVLHHRDGALQCSTKWFGE
jgi:hypothetical protein